MSPLNKIGKRSRSKSGTSQGSSPPLSPEYMVISPDEMGPDQGTSESSQKKTKRRRKKGTKFIEPIDVNARLSKISVLEKFILDRIQTTPISKPPTTVTNKLNIINDSCVTRASLSELKYLIHYEIYKDKPYPIITIPKGTMLFNGRRLTSPTTSESFSHLYKIHGHDNLQSYIDDIEQTYTYFFPVGYMINVIDSNFKTIDIVTTTKDIRLLALISPSPIGRAMRHEGAHKYVKHNFQKKKQLYDALNFYDCAERNYDLCIDPRIIQGMNLNGYIGIASEDGMHAHYKKLNKLMDNKLESSDLFRACTFNNGIKDAEIKMPVYVDLISLSVSHIITSGDSKTKKIAFSLNCEDYNINSYPVESSGKNLFWDIPKLVENAAFKIETGFKVLMNISIIHINFTCDGVKAGACLIPISTLINTPPNDKGQTEFSGDIKYGSVIGQLKFTCVITPYDGSRSGGGNYPIVDFMKRHREYGIPEIVLIPLDLDECKNAEQYTKIKNDFVDHGSSVNSDMFVFKPLHTVMGYNTYMMTKDLDKYLTDNKDNISKSYQAPHLFSMWRSEMNNESRKLIPKQDHFTRGQLNFAESYLSKKPGFCAFELMSLYISISNFVEQNRATLQQQYDIANRVIYDLEDGEIEEDDRIHGGFRNKSANRGTNLGFLKMSSSFNSNVNKKNTNKDNRVTKSSNKKKNTRITMKKRTPKTIEEEFSESIETFDKKGKIHFDIEDKFYYSESSGIPVIFCDKEQ